MVIIASFHAKLFASHTHSFSTDFFQGNVELWLGSLLRVSRESVHNVISQAFLVIQDPSFNLVEFENSYPAQVPSMVVIVIGVLIVLAVFSLCIDKEH